MARWFLIIFLFLSTIVSFLFVYNYQTQAAAYYLAIVSLVLFVLVAGLEVLNYRIGGQFLTIEKRINDVAAEQEEVKLLAIAAYQALHVLADGSSRWGGSSKEHIELMKKYLDPISKHLPENTIEEVNTDIAEILSKYIQPPNK